MFFKKQQRTTAELIVDHLLFWQRVMEENYAKALFEEFPPEHPRCRCVYAPIKIKLPVDKNGWPVSVSKFETVADAFNAGKTVRRVAWKTTVSGIVKLPNTRFVTLLLPNGTSKSWQPYAEDFAADDWYVV